jgi:YjbE family integral membrane protein
MMHNLNVPHLAELLGASGGLDSAELWVAALQIVVINALLSGDNAIVIAMACRDLPPRERLWGMIIGSGGAVILRIVFAGVVARLLLLPYLKLVGGVALIAIAAKLLVSADPDKDEVEAAAHLWRAVRIVIVADVVMSFDNVIAVAAAAKGQLLLLVIGLTISIPIIIAGAAIIMALLNRFPILVWAGAALLGWVGADTAATDPAVFGYISRVFGANFAQQMEFAAAAAGTLLAMSAGGLWQQISLSRARTQSTTSSRET